MIWSYNCWSYNWTFFHVFSLFKMPTTEDATHHNFLNVFSNQELPFVSHSSIHSPFLSRRWVGRHPLDQSRAPCFFWSWLKLFVLPLDSLVQVACSCSSLSLSFSELSLCLSFYTSQHYNTHRYYKKYQTVISVDMFFLITLSISQHYSILLPFFKQSTSFNHLSSDKLPTHTIY